MKHRVIKKRMHQLTGSHNSYSKTRKLLKRIRMGHTHPWYMASDLKFNMRFANFPITTNDTLWTAYLRLKRVHHRQIKYRAIRNVKMEDILQAEYGTN